MVFLFCQPLFQFKTVFERDDPVEGVFAFRIELEISETYELISVVGRRVFERLFELAGFDQLFRIGIEIRVVFA